jgi:hypothetical protein
MAGGDGFDGAKKPSGDGARSRITPRTADAPRNQVGAKFNHGGAERQKSEGKSREIEALHTCESRVQRMVGGVYRRKSLI